MADWQPIETADKRRHILGGFKNCEAVILRWYKYNGQAAWRDWDGDPHTPSHWMPLPEPPSQ